MPCQSAGADGYPVWKRFQIVRGDTFAFSTRVCFSGVPEMLDDSGRVTLALTSDKGAQNLYRFTSEDQDENGYVSISLLPEETAALSVGRYNFEVEFYFSDELVVTALVGVIDVLEDTITEEVRNNGGN